jgi:hypothetical protein
MKCPTLSCQYLCGWVGGGGGGGEGGVMMTLMGVGVCHDEYRWPVPPSLPIQLEFNHVPWSVRKGLQACMAK